MLQAVKVLLYIFNKEFSSCLYELFLFLFEL